MVEYSPATGETRVRFPVGVALTFLYYKSVFLVQLRLKLCVKYKLDFFFVDQQLKQKEAEMCSSQPMGFEPTRGDHIGLAVRHLNRSVTVA